MTSSEPTSPGLRRPSSAVVTVLAGLLLAVLVAVLVLVIRDRDDDQSGPGAAGALVVARQEALNFFSLDYRHPEADVAHVLELATGEFKAQYSAKQEQLIAQVRKEKVVTTASVPQDGVALEYLSGGSAQVLVAVDVDQPAGVKVFGDRNRARIVLEVVGDRWLVTAVNQVG